MRSKLLKRILFGFLIVLSLFCILMLTPRFWAAIYPDKPPVGYHFETLDYIAIGVGLEKLINKTPEIPESIEEIKNIEYKNVNGKSLQLDLYRPKNIGKKIPLLVFIHGGGWRGGQRSDYLVYLVAFAKREYMTATVSYRLLKDGPYPACAEDISDAVSWFFANSEKYGYDPDRIALIGGSAGGHLSTLIGYGWKSSVVKNDSISVLKSAHKIKAIVDIYGPFDLTTEYARNHSLVTSFLAKKYEEDPGVFVEASPAHYLGKDAPPTLILHGTSDNLVPVSQSDILKQKLDSLGVPSVYYRLPLWPHTMDIVKRVNDFCEVKMNDFFVKYLN